jgi:hypothetical protein
MLFLIPMQGEGRIRSLLNVLQGMLWKKTDYKITDKIKFKAATGVSAGPFFV